MIHLIYNFVQDVTFVTGTSNKTIQFVLTLYTSISNAINLLAGSSDKQESQAPPPQPRLLFCSCSTQLFTRDNLKTCSPNRIVRLFIVLDLATDSSSISRVVLDLTSLKRMYFVTERIFSIFFDILITESMLH